MKRMIIGGGVVGALLALIVFSVVPVEGSEIEKGKQIYEEKRCGLCHIIEGKDGKMGPDLSDVGNARDGEWLMKFLKDPKGTVAGAKMIPVKASEEELSALVEYLLSLKK